MLAWLGSFATLMRGIIGMMCARLGVWGAAVSVVALLVTDNIVELWERCKGDVYKAITDIAEEKTGLLLDPNEPHSDASISAALTAKSGIQITTVKDAEVLAGDLARHAAGLLEQHTTVHFTNLLSGEQVKADIVGHARGKVKEHTGLDLDGAASFDAIQARISEHVQNKLAELVVTRLHSAAVAFSNPDATLDDLLAMVYRAQEAKGIRARDVALGVAASMVVAAYARTSTPIKRRVEAYRRRAQNREAQRRFRVKHGNRAIYAPLPPAEEGGTSGGGT